MMTAVTNMLVKQRDHSDVQRTNQDQPTGVGDHCRATGHSVSMDNTKVLTQEANWHKRDVNEAIYIR